MGAKAGGDPIVRSTIRDWERGEGGCVVLQAVAMGLFLFWSQNKWKCMQGYDQKCAQKGQEPGHVFRILRAGVIEHLRLSSRSILAFCRPTMPCGASRR